MKVVIYIIMMALTACSTDSFPHPDQLLAKELANENSPAIQYLVFNQDSVIYKFQQGLANINQQRSISDEASFNVYSTTKTFTALAILQLVEQDKVNLDASIKTYLPDSPFPSTITIRHLLSHTSGIPNPIPLNWIHLAQEDSTFNEIEFFKPILAKNSELKFQPGEKFAYTNLGYVLLGQVIALVTGIPYKKYITQHIINPLDLPPGALGFQIYDNNRHVTGYHKRWSFSNILLSFLIDKSKFMGKAENAWQSFNPLYVNGAAYGGLVATTWGMVKYLQEFLKPETNLISPASKQLLFRETVTTANKPTGMCLSWYTGVLNGVRYYTHAGGGGGFYVEMRIYPEKRIGSLIVFNRSGLTDERFLDKVDKFFI